MSIKSMTGFARSQGALADTSWHWEVRCVNGRGLDVRLRLPPGYESLEPRIREAVSAQLVRGSAAVNLTVRSEQPATEIRLNTDVLEQVLKAAEHVHHLAGCEMPRADGLLALRGVLEVVEVPIDEAQQKAVATAMLESLDKALSDLVVARRSEGARLRESLLLQVDEIERLAGVAAASPARAPEAIRARLEEQVARLVSTRQSLDPERLHQEAILLATRADIEEELTRIASHISAARELLDAPEPVGRKLDFLAQEFTREANTLCSKANDGEISRSGLAMKAVIDQIREQVQNIE